jgi:signal transduction histidine kinase
VKRIETNEKSLLSLINEMLGFVNAEKGGVVVEGRNAPIAEMFDAAEPLIKRDVERKHIVFTRELARPDLAVHADPKSLQQILTSLLTNAAKYTGEGGTITLGAHSSGEKVRIWVRDNGIGIREEQMQRVFEPFFQADGGTTRLYSGVGLGLTIARDLARRRGGEVTLASEVDRGTTASIILPAAKEGDEESTAAEVLPAA